MSKTTVDKLPDKVLIEVFNWLDSKSLENVEETSEKWKKIARSTPRTLELDGKRKMEPSMNSLLASRRKYDKAVIRGKLGAQQKFLEVFVMHGANVRQLEIRNSNLNDATIWCQVLKTMPVLKEVKIWDAINGNFGVDLNVADLLQVKDLSKMESLELLNSSCNLLKLFEKCQLKTLTVNTSTNLQNRESLLNFLATQKSLEKLKLSSKGMFTTPIPDEFITFQLKKLVLWEPSHYKTPNHNNFSNFMKLHAGTLEELELDGKFPNSFYEIIFAKLKDLKNLRLNCMEIPHEPSFYERLAVNRSVISLILSGNTKEVLPSKALINHLPNIETLSLHHSNDRSFIEHVAETLKKLKKLDVRYFYGQLFNGLRFEALQCLEIHSVDCLVNWNEFTKSNPGISELSIEYVLKQEDIDIHAITKNLKNLHTLTIKYKFNCDENFFAVIRQNCKELKSINLNTQSLKVDISDVADIPGLRFRNF